MDTVRELVTAACARLSTCTEQPRTDSEVLLAFVLDKGRSWLFAHPEFQPGPAQSQRFRSLIDLRAQGHPISHLTGHRDFWTITLTVTPDTLIPRPETEHLVELALQTEIPPHAQVLDLGTGSGAVALALAAERPAWRLLATDRSTKALTVARANAARLGLNNISFLESNWFDSLAAGQMFDLIVSNPPYIAGNDRHMTQGDLRFEPREALVSGIDGLRDIDVIIRGACRHLHAGGWLWLEHGHDQQQAVEAMLRESNYSEIRSQRDLAGQPRNSGGRWIPTLDNPP
jgi:release factor glutamine methyltransferase